MLCFSDVTLCFVLQCNIITCYNLHRYNFLSAGRVPRENKDSRIYQRPSLMVCAYWHMTRVVNVMLYDRDRDHDRDVTCV